MTEPLREPVPVRHAGTADLVDLLDRVVDRGAVISGDLIIGLAGVDLIRLDLNLVLAAVETLDQFEPPGVAARSTASPRGEGS